MGECGAEGEDWVRRVDPQVCTYRVLPVGMKVWVWEGCGVGKRWDQWGAEGTA